MEYADGCDLRTKMASLENNMTEEMALKWFTQACLGLAEMHANSIVHRDIKPENILIVGNRAKLGDFGTIKNMHFSTQLTYVVGTPHYFAPEKRS